MNLEFDAGISAFRAEVAVWPADHLPARPSPSVDTPRGLAWYRAFEAELADARPFAVDWPAECGGRDASLLEWLVFECARILPRLADTGRGAEGLPACG